VASHHKVKLACSLTQILEPRLRMPPVQNTNLSVERKVCGRMSVTLLLLGVAPLG
jgi:hypothetical protein